MLWLESQNPFVKFNDHVKIVEQLNGIQKEQKLSAVILATRKEDTLIYGKY